MSQARAGFIGLGNIGKPMALRLAAWEGGWSVFDISEEPLADAAAAGATVAASVAELAADCGVIMVMVNTDAQVEQVMADILPAARPGSVIVIHSTIAPELAPQLEQEALAHDLLLVDAPVSGGAMGAADGTLAIMVGGSDAAFAAAKGPLALLGSELVHCGPVGAGTQAKLARNLLHFVAFTATAEAARLAEAAGIDLVDLGRIVRHTDAITGGPGAIMYRETAAPMGPDDGWRGIFEPVVALGHKDLTHAIALADQLGVAVPMARYAREHLAAALGVAPANQPAQLAGEEN